MPFAYIVVNVPLYSGVLEVNGIIQEVGHPLSRLDKTSEFNSGGFGAAFGGHSIRHGPV